MKGGFLGCLCLGLLVSGGAQNQGKREACYDSARSQAALNECAGGDLAKADRELNRTYQRILKKYAKDALFLQRLKQAQRAWLAFRDAEIDMKFPSTNTQELTARYGSVYPICFASYKAGLTEQRTKELSIWLKGIEEGDVCSGSVKTPEALR
jgi:uncharacterized protein YecT (DUF1311 family)